MSDAARVTPRLIVSSSAEAIDFYTKAFGAEELERFATPEGFVVHAKIRIGESEVMLADSDPGWGNQDPSHLEGSAVILSLRCDPDAVCAKAVEHGAEVLIPVDDRFYGAREGRIRDPFGHLWILSKPLREMTRDEIQRGLDDFAAG